jgi:hypothetical protein
MRLVLGLVLAEEHVGGGDPRQDGARLHRKRPLLGAQGLAEMASLTQEQRRRVLEHAKKVNAL